MTSHSHVPRKAVVLANDEPETKADQSFKKSVDINRIMERYTKTGNIEHARNYEGQYADVSEIDFQRSLEIVSSVRSMFHDLPAATRARFEHNAGKFLAFVQDPQNAETLRSLGLNREAVETHDGHQRPAQAATPAEPPAPQGAEPPGQSGGTGPVST